MPIVMKIMDAFKPLIAVGSDDEDDEPDYHNYTSYLFSPIFSDFTLKSSECEEFKVHRIILAESSPVFKKMFTVEMQEKEYKSVEFPDINSSVLKHVLGFIYADRYILYRHSAKEDIDVLYAAEKFDIAGLKARCIEELMKNVTVVNVLEIYPAADLYNIKDLDRKCLDIIIRWINLKMFTGKKDWLLFISNYEHLKGTAKWNQLTVPLVTKITDEFVKINRQPQFTLESTL